METAELLKRLGYLESPAFLSAERGDFNRVIDFGHVFRRAAETPCSLRGVYCLRDKPETCVPIVYVCEAPSEAQAEDIHKLVWNQNVVPFLIVSSPESLRVYPAFRYEHRRPAGTEGFLRTLRDFNDAGKLADLLAPFQADAVDGGELWRRWGDEVTPERRVDWRLLENLRELDEWLEGPGKLDRHASHQLIGKYVYLHYLRDRGILSRTELEDWGIPKQEVFGRGATRDGLRAVVKELESWLNGDVFPLDLDGRRAPSTEQIRRVAGTFAGDQLLDDRSWQLHLDFKAYDFSYIPIETLSVVYEQFLHAAEESGESRGRQAGAYYTPIPVVNFMLAELEEQRRLQRGMRVLDPACGSGAFLVQSYRRLIEREFRPGQEPGPTVVELRELLKKHIFGIDSDPDACSVTELSLIVTLLDYVHPRDLEKHPPQRRPKLPKLRDENIVCDDFFNQDGSWRRSFLRKKFDWVVGNPPWKQLNPKKLKPADEAIWRWMRTNDKERPVGSNQTARAFAWEAAEYVGEGGLVGMFLPAMTLFENPARDFRRKFLRAMRVRTVANFANLAEVISGGRFRMPAAAFFYAPRPSDRGETEAQEESIRTYSPLVANQEATRPSDGHTRNETWSIVVNASEIRDIPLPEVADGSGLPWKLATWGSQLDRRLLSSLARRFGSLKDLEKAGQLTLSQGLELRRKGVGDEDLEPIPAVVGRNRLDVKPLKRLRRFFAFPREAIKLVDPELDHGREGRIALPLAVCRPPHVIVSAARNFAIYSEEFLIVPPRQIGIASPSDDTELPKAISLFLSSDFAFYHQFLTSTQFGVQMGRATLKALREMPVPLAALPRNELAAWVDLHGRLAEATREAFARQAPGPLFGEGPGHLAPAPLVRELNDLVYDSLGLDREERALVRDLVQVRLELNDGKLGEPAVREPTRPEIRRYAGTLKTELDDFVADELSKRHKVDVVYDDFSGMVRVDLVADRAAARRMVVDRADRPITRELEKARRRLRTQRSQWVYFDRNLRIYEGSRTFIFKPMQRFHWTQTQARLDAREIVAETLNGGDGA
jgi:hypothetical protein